MIKKNNKILVGALALLLCLTIGYALFSDTLTINGTATAQGDFGISTICMLEPDDKVKEFANFSISNGADEAVIDEVLNDYGAENKKCTVNGNNISFSSNFLYPGAHSIFFAKITNTGSIDIIIKDMAQTSTTDVCVNNEDGTQTCYQQRCHSGGQCTSNIPGESGDHLMWISASSFFPLKADGTLPTTVEEFESFYTPEGNIILKPGESVYYGLESSAGKKYIGNGPGAVVGADGKFDIEASSTTEIPFEQITAK